ncbi:ergothioneine biosynthesis protein EgtC [Nocardia cerradoensis]|uniref:ergothioneine biosynthesis protein EgtC n=1 Tax=Nocardia cerradoensis TaxID=85688 RepID=UPI0003123DD6|nr:ergothioneine biosynthesis protein EgtC [Nocardia cerradoensis]NKY46194.1 ergothioneine biosynthesis protein EgtC [Nocardia cerradoensis]
MCRHLGYLGPPAPIGELLTRGTHSLRTQSWAPNDMRHGGTVNADGFGVAWWTDEGAASRYRNSAPIWTDPAVEEVLPQLSSPAVLAAVRSATVGMPVERTACAPFTDGGWAFSHNGVIQNWRTVLPVVAKQFGSPDLLDAESATDSAALWVVLRAALDGIGALSSSFEGRSESDARLRAVAAAVTATVRAVLAPAPSARLNLLLGDGETLWATTVHHSLSVLVTDEVAVVSSEPYDDDPRWQAITDRQVVTVRPGLLVVEPLDAAPSTLSAGPDESERARS